MLGPARTAYAHSSIVVATDGSLKKNGAMGAAFITKDDRPVERRVAVLGPPSSTTVKVKPFSRNYYVIRRDFL